MTSWQSFVRDDVALVDTDVWSYVIFTPRDREPRVAAWRASLLGMDVVIAAQTEGELRYGSMVKKWGPQRMAGLEARRARTPTAAVTAEVIRTFAAVRAECKGAGHPLADKVHMGDAWVAATALAYGLPLLSGDAIYRRVPGLRLLDAAA